MSPVNRYRWRRLLRSCDLDPGLLQEPLDEPDMNDFIICGCPRSGTSLLAGMLFRPPASVVAMEPWDGLRLEPAQLFDSLRTEIMEEGVLRRGRLDVGALEREGRMAWVRDEEQPVPLVVEPGFRLGVKWPAFWRYLDLLANTRFLVCVRDPVEVISSMAGTGGRLAAGYDYDVAFNRGMNTYLRTATDEPPVRRALLYEYVNSRILPHLGNANVKVVRYERWYEDPDLLLSEVAEFLGLEGLERQVRLRPPNPVKQPERIEPLVERYVPSARQLGYPVAT
jgi:hypothetical protein